MAQVGGCVRGKPQHLRVTTIETRQWTLRDNVASAQHSGASLKELQSGNTFKPCWAVRRSTGSALSAQFPIIAKQYSFVRKKAGERVSRRRSRRIREQNKEQRGSGGGGRRTGPAARNMPEMGSLAQASPPESGGGRGNCK